MTKKERIQLIAILNKIQDNSLDAWEHNMANTSPVVALADFNKYDKYGEDIKEEDKDIEPVIYNGWMEDLCNLAGVKPNYPTYKIVMKDENN